MLCCAGLLARPAELRAAPAADTAPRLVVEAPADLDWVEEAEFRLPALRFATDAMDPAEVDGTVRFLPLDDGRWRLELELADGRGFSKEIEIASDDRGRELVSALENLLAVAGIETRTLEPEPEPKPEAEPDDEPVEEEPETPTHLIGPEAGQLVPPFVSPWLAGGAVFGFQGSNGLRGAGGELGVDLRFAKGFTLRTGFRILGATPAAFTLMRGRWSFGAGYTLMRGNFEMPMLAGVKIERWRVRDSGSRLGVALVPAQSDARQRVFILTERSMAEAVRPLVGAHLSLEPRLRFPVDRGPLDAVFVGVRVEAAVTGLPPGFARFEIVRELDRERGQSASGGGPEIGAMLTAGVTLGRREKVHRRP